LEARRYSGLGKQGEKRRARGYEMTWYCGASVPKRSTCSRKTRCHLPPLLVLDVYRFDGRRIIVGRMETGNIEAGDQLVFSPANKSSIVVILSVECRRTAPLWPEIPSESD
jgi:sulfate adenylyltransferase subunit 1 (EFTu-like GTPase family)